MSKIKLFVIVLLACLGTGKLFAQQSNIFSQYYYNLPAQNPAFTGMDPFLNVKFGFRQSWNDFANTNNSIFFSADAALGQNSSEVLKHNVLRTSQQQKGAKKNSRRHHGLGGMVLSQKIGPYELTQLNLNYAYHLPLSSSWNLAMGTRVAYGAFKLDYSDLTVRDEASDAVYQSLVNAGAGQQQNILVDFGVTLYTDKFYMGISSVNLTSAELNSDALEEAAPESSYKANLGWNLTLNRNFDLLPSADITYNDLYGMNWQATARLRYRDLIYLGLSYEQDIRTSLLFGLSFENTYYIHYSYDYFTNDLSDFNKGNHEFAVGILLFNKYAATPKFW
ncbi:PorP/SprF family type IX secretion system membrane protein [Fulvivirga ligni]|uniref:PorP/SprF family type IX secretion system membrane protein n=1 Tax=Fulvivirga ligni TaxID=2904246 RepID=UPI001F4893F1|nr:PorP/SprF family type IX secretion system membrane protein [Fulvivirga ligni]UII19186.1 PorP/SprF family type IX secretion system membrane protein [Fulvivirga ligni]